MAYWERAPDPRLEEYVERISFSTDPAGEPSAPIRVVPAGSSAFLMLPPMASIFFLSSSVCV